jgi:Peptidase A4 family
MTKQRLSTAAERTRRYPVPSPPVQDPSKWTDDKITEYGLPARPNADDQPAAARLWLETFGRTLRFLEFAAGAQDEVQRTRLVQIDALGGEPALPEPPSSDAVVASAGHFEDSLNWSGAFLNATLGRTFRQIHGRWTVPTLQPPPGQTAPSYECSCWIGLDGQRRYVNATLPQCGTDHVLEVGGTGMTMSCHAWIQWWAPNDPSTTPVPVAGFPVNPGDRIRAVLTVLDSSNVLCNLINDSTHPPTIVPVTVTAPTIPGQGMTQYKISGATAEWVMERPAVIDHPDQLQPFPNYGTTIFTGCVADEAHSGGSSPILRTLATSRFIRMYEVRFNPQRTAFISMPHRIADSAFRVNYGDVWS